MMQNLVDAKAARARKNVTLELQKLMAVVALKRKVVAVEQARARIKAIDKIAAGGMDVVEKEVSEKRFEDAIHRLEQLEKTYPGTLTASASPVAMYRGS